MKKIIVAAVVLIGFGSCSSTNSDGGNAKSDVTVQVNEINLATKPDHWINERVTNAQEKLDKSEAGKLVWQSMEAHGGLKQWFENGVLSFRFDYIPLGKGMARRTTQQIDTWSNRAVHQDVTDVEDTFGWDGANAWAKRNDTLDFPYNLRFWALTPYYFLGQPFIFDGAGVKLEKLADRTFEGKAYDVVKISFEAGTGDAPDDYYINYYDKETHLMKVIRYIVSYPAYFKDGGHNPEKMMVVNGYETTSGITLPASYSTYSLNEDQTEIKEKVTEVEVSGVSFIPSIEEDFFEIPEGAKIVGVI